MSDAYVPHAPGLFEAISRAVESNGTDTVGVTKAVRRAAFIHMLQGWKKIAAEVTQGRDYNPQSDRA